MRFAEFNIREDNSFDPQIQAIQKELIKLGYNVGPGGANGIKGPETTAAAMQYLNDVKSGKRQDIKMGGVSSNNLAKTVMPVDAPVTQQYGHNGHPGVDLGSPMNTPVKAPVSGTVHEAGVEKGCGNTVSIIASNGETHRFCHLITINVRSGQQVKAGDVVGASGGAQQGPTRGWSTGPHLHWEKYVAGHTVDPMRG